MYLFDCFIVLLFSVDRMLVKDLKYPRIFGFKGELYYVVLVITYYINLLVRI